MVRQLRPVLMRCALIGLAGLVSSPAIAAMAARGFGGHAAPRVIMAPRIVRNAPLRNTPIGRNARHEFLDRHRFHRDGSFIGDGTIDAVPVPVRVEGGATEAYPSEPPIVEFGEGGGYGGRRPANPGPQIIELPDAPKRGASRAAAPEAARRAPAWPGRDRMSRANAFDAAAPHHYGRPLHRHHGFGWYRPAWPVHREPSPIALAPCNDGAFGPIYNTPCGAHPYE